MTGAQVLAERRAYEKLYRDVTEEDRTRWVRLAQFCRSYPEFLERVEEKHPKQFKQVCAGFRILAIDAKSGEWRSTKDGVGGRKEQLLPGTRGSFSADTAWRYWLLMGGRGSGKSRCGAEAIRELLFGTRWTIKNVRVAFVGRTLTAVRQEMFLNTFIEILPPGCILAWRSQVCELVIALPSGGIATINGYSADAPDTVRGPNIHLAWADEIAAWNDADRGIAVPGTAFSNLNYTLRAKATDANGNEWRPRLIATTTPKSVRLLRNKKPDHIDPGLGLADAPQCVVSSMSTLDNLANLAPSFYETSIEPYIGTRLFRQEVQGELMDEAVGAEWSADLIDKMYRPPAYVEAQAGGLYDVVIGVDPATIDDPENAEHGIVVSGLAEDGNAYALEDATMRGRPSEVCDKIAELVEYWGASRIVVEVNNGGAWVTDNLGRAYPHLAHRIVSVWAKKGKKVRAQPVALLSDKGRVFLAGSFPELEHQMMNYTGDRPDHTGKRKAGPSPDRLDAFVYSIIALLPVEGGLGEAVTVISSVPTVRR